MAGQTSEVEETLKRLQGHKGVIGVVIVNQDGIPIRTTFDQAVTVQYAGLITQLCSKARSAVRELDPQVRNLSCAIGFPNHVTLIHQLRAFAFLSLGPFRTVCSVPRGGCQFLMLSSSAEQEESMSKINLVSKIHLKHVLKHM